MTEREGYNSCLPALTLVSKKSSSEPNHSADQTAQMLEAVTGCEQKRLILGDHSEVWPVLLGKLSITTGHHQPPAEPCTLTASACLFRIPPRPLCLWLLSYLTEQPCHSALTLPLCLQSPSPPPARPHSTLSTPLLQIFTFRFQSQPTFHTINELSFSRSHVFCTGCCINLPSDLHTCSKDCHSHHSPALVVS